MNNKPDRSRGIYRSRNGHILGVCRGVADYADFSVFWTRVIVLILIFMTGFWPLLLFYFLAALLMKPEPVIPIESSEEQEFYNSCASSKNLAVERLRRTYSRLQTRLQRLEDMVTRREFDWDKRMSE